MLIDELVAADADVDVDAVAASQVEALVVDLDDWGVVVKEDEADFFCIGRLMVNTLVLEPNGPSMDIVSQEG